MKSRKPSDPEEPLYEMANLGPKHTGLPFMVWISTGEGARNDVRVSVSRDAKVQRSDLISVAIRPDVRVIEPGSLPSDELALLRRWVDLNRDVLIRYWDGDIEDTPDVIAALRKLA